MYCTLFFCFVHSGFWELHGKDAETIWEQVNICILLDTKNGKAGNELDEFQAHRFLEQLGNTLQNTTSYFVTLVSIVGFFFSLFR